MQGDPAAEYRAFREGAALVGHPAAGVVRVAGPDARSFLDALVSQSLAGLSAGQGGASLLLQPTGKMGIAFRVLVVAGAGGDEEFWLDCGDEWGGPLAGALQRYLLRVDCTVEDRSDEWGVRSVRGPASVEVVAEAFGVDVPAEQHAHVTAGEARLVRADWAGGAGIDVVAPHVHLARAHEALVEAGAVVAGAEAAEAVRIEAGEPRQGVDLDDSVIPQEAFLEHDAVSFDKGCFLGQELVCRIRDRGRVNRHLRRLALDNGAVPPSGAELLDGDRAVGAVTSAAAIPGEGRVVALGYLRREVEPGSSVDVRWDGGQSHADVLGPPPGE